MFHCTIVLLYIEDEMYCNVLPVLLIDSVTVFFFFKLWFSARTLCGNKRRLLEHFHVCD